MQTLDIEILLVTNLTIDLPGHVGNPLFCLQEYRCLVMEVSASAVCPYCQMPLKLLHVLTFNLHLEVCFRRKKPQKECPKGLNCDSCMVSHYERFSHTLLAKKYSNNNDTEVVVLEKESNATESPSTEEDFECSNLFTNQRNFSGCKKRKPDKMETKPTVDVTQPKQNKGIGLKKSHKGCIEAPVVNDLMTDSLSTDDSEKWPATDAKGPGFIPHEPTADIVAEFSLNNLNSNNSDNSQEAFSAEIVRSANDFGNSETDLDHQEKPMDNNAQQIMDSFSATSTQMPKTQEPFTTLDATHSFSLSPKVGNTVHYVQKALKKDPTKIKSKQGDIGSMLFGMKPSKNKPEIKNTAKEEYASQPVRKCPFYKKIGNAQIAVDAFNYGNVPGIKTYYLSHFHYDHYIGLTKRWEQKVFCSNITGNLVETKLKLSPEKIVRMPMNKKVENNGHFVIFLEANHCPGAVLMLFQLKSGQVILHSGDFRADKDLCANPFISGVQINTLYLDTTYLDPSYAFPPQKTVIEFTKMLVQRTAGQEPKTLFVTGTYCIGKEKIFLCIAEVLKCKIFVTRDKFRTMSCLDSPEVNSLLTLSGKETVLHVLPMKNLNAKSLSQHLKKFGSNFVRILAIKPTGWTHANGSNNLEDIKPTCSDKIQIYGIPYSEHSSFDELREFVTTHKPDKIIPTVNVGRLESRQKMEKYLNEWKKK